jgi:hypothetical protein
MEQPEPTILYQLGIVPVDKDQLPIGHRKVSVPLSISSDTAIIASMRATLSTVCKVTRTGDRITFWRELPKQVSKGDGLKFRAKAYARWRNS